MGHSVIPVSREFIHGCSRSTQLSRPFPGRRNEEQLCAAIATDTSFGLLAQARKLAGAMLKAMEMRDQFQTRLALIRCG